MRHWGCAVAGGERGAQRYTAAQRRDKVVALRRQRLSFGEIGQQLGVSESMARKIYDQVIKAIPAANLEAHRVEELERLDELERKAINVLEGLHPLVQQGRIINRGHKDESGTWVVDEELVDSGPVLAALDRVLKIQERRAKLLGLDAPAKTEVNVGAVDPASIELRLLLEQRAERNAAEKERLSAEDSETS